MEDLRKDEVWEVLGRVPRRTPSPWLVGHVLREVRRPHTSRWGITDLSWARFNMFVGAASMLLLLLATPVAYLGSEMRAKHEQTKLFAAFDALADRELEEGFARWTTGN